MAIDTAALELTREHEAVEGHKPQLPTLSRSAEQSEIRRAPKFKPGAGFWVIAAAFLTVMAFSTVPTPLYSIYQQRDGFPTFVITVIFAAYAVGVMASLYFVGHISDWAGRRRMILVAILLEIVAAVVFLVWTDVPGLIVARVITGLGVGALTATATAHLSELRASAHPEEKGGFVSATVSTVVNIGGLAFGPLVAGFLAQYIAAPLVAPYVVFLALLAVAALAVALVPETVEKNEERPAYRPQRVSIPAASRPVFFAAGAGVFAAFAIFGLFTSLAPTFVAGQLHETSRLVAGAVTFGVFGSAATAQVFLARLPIRRQLVLATTLMVIGLLGIVAGVLTESLALFVIAGIIAGAGVGLLFRSSLGVAGSLASPGTRGEVLAAMFLIAYAGLAIPVLAIGVSVAFLSTTVTLVGFAAVILVLVAIAAQRMLATIR